MGVRGSAWEEFFFLTRAGKLYCWKEEKKTSVEEVWIPGARPVRTVVFDSDTRTAWAFTLHGEAGGKRRGVYFPLSAEREYANYRLAWEKNARTPEPLLEIYRVASFLKTEKKIGP